MRIMFRRGAVAGALAAAALLAVSFGSGPAAAAQSDRDHSGTYNRYPQSGAQSGYIYNKYGYPAPYNPVMLPPQAYKGPIYLPEPTRYYVVPQTYAAPARVYYYHAPSRSVYYAPTRVYAAPPARTFYAPEAGYYYVR
jgi:hypothetical protein